MQLTRRAQKPEILQVAVQTPAELAAAPGAEEMFCEIYRRVHDQGIAHAERFLSTGEAEDAVGEAVAKVWRVWSKLRLDQQSDAYFYAAIHHEVINRLRHNDRLVESEEAEVALARLAITEIDASEPDERARLMDRIVDAMPTRRREVFLLVRELGYTYKEAAELLGLSEGSVNTHMRLATDDVRNALQRLGLTLQSGGARLLPAPQGSKEESHD